LDLFLGVAVGLGQWLGGDVGAGEHARQLQARIVVPHHYHIWDVTTRGSTLLPADEWVKTRPNARWLGEGSLALLPQDVKAQSGSVVYFGEHVAFAKPNTREDKVGA